MNSNTEPDTPSQDDMEQQVASMFQEAAREILSPNEEKPSTSLVVREPTELTAEAASETEIRAFLRQMANHADADTVDIFNVLAAAQAANVLDPIMARIRYRSDITKMTVQLSSNTRALTSIAQALDVRIGNEPITADPNFATWPEEKMRILVAKIGAHIDTLIDREVTAIARARELDARCTMLEEKVEQLSQLNSQIATMRSEEVDRHKQAVLEANTALTSYFDTSSFIVAQVNTTTGAPERFLKLVKDEEGETYKSVTEWKKATRFSYWQRAQDIRVRLVKMLRKRAPRVEHEQIGEACQTFQVCLRHVTHEDFE